MEEGSEYVFHPHLKNMRPKQETRKIENHRTHSENITHKPVMTKEAIEPELRKIIFI